MNFPKSKISDSWLSPTVCADHLSIIMPNDFVLNNRQPKAAIAVRSRSNVELTNSSTKKQTIIDHAAQSATTPFEQFAVTIAAGLLWKSVGR